MPQIPITVRSPDDRPLVKVAYETIPQPAPGQNAILVVPQGYRLQIRSLYAQIVTDANVADRFLFLSIQAANGILYYYSPPFAITASETRYLTLAPSLTLISHSITNMTAVWPLPLDYPLEEGVILTLGLANIQVGDQLSTINMMNLSQFVAE